MLYKKDGTYHVDITVKGKRVRRSTFTSDKSRAQRFHDKMKADLWDSQFANSECSPTWEQAKKNWFKLKREKKSFNRDWTKIQKLSKFFNGKHLNELPFDEAFASVNGPVQLNRYKTLLVSMYNALDLTPPKFTFTKEKPRECILDDKSFGELIEVLPDSLRDLVQFAAETGLRKSNILSLDLSHYDDRVQAVRFSADEMKNGKPFSAPISNLAKEILFRNKFKFRFKTTEWKAFKAAAEKIGLPELRFHDLRHYFATRKGSNGAPIGVVGALLGHESVRSTERYRHYFLEELRNYV